MEMALACAWVGAGASVVTCIVGQRELHEDVCQGADIVLMGVLVGFAVFLAALQKSQPPFVLEGSSYIGQHCAGDIGFVMADAI